MKLENWQQLLGDLNTELKNLELIVFLTAPHLIRKPIPLSQY